jgi:alkanesulfonate monooxygenase SsuD/methylene tetrahydromethanopterin reductase-like flavin-dependent oxidoreductase (luciferase family)
MGIMDIGVFIAAEPHNRGPAEDLHEMIDLAQAIEELGYRSLFTASRHFSSGYAAVPSPLVLFAAVAERTTTLEFGPSVVTLPLENIHRLAEDFAVLDAISGGRAVLGVGSGDDPPAFAAMGVEFDERAGMLSQTIEKFLDILQGGDAGAGMTLYPPIENALDKVALGAQSARGAAWAASLGIGLQQGRSEPNSWDPTVSQVRAAEAYRAVHPSGRISTARNAWVGTVDDPELWEGIRRHDEFLKSRGLSGMPEDPKEALRKLNVRTGTPEGLAIDLKGCVASIKPDELLITPDPGGLEASDRLKRLTALAEAFGLGGK